MQKMLTSKELAAIFGVTEATVGWWRASGSGPKHFKIGGSVRYREQDVEDWIENKVVEIEKVAVKHDQGARQGQDVVVRHWQETIGAHLSREPWIDKEWISTAALLEICGLPSRRVNTGHARTLAQAMRSLGWCPSMTRCGGKLRRGYRRPTSEVDELVKDHMTTADKGPTSGTP